MTTPLRAYLYEDQILPSTWLHASTGVAGAGADNLVDFRPGKMAQLGSSFILRDNASDYIQIANADTGDTVAFTLADDGYTGAALASYLTPAIAAEFAGNPGYVDPQVTVAYDNATRLFTFTSVANTIIYWTTNARTQGLAVVMGWDGDADTASGKSHVSDNATFVKDRQWCAWDLGAAASEPECFMVYAANLGSADKFYLYGHDTDLGSNPDDWEGALYKSGATAVTHSEVNDLLVWDTTISGIHARMRYWSLQWTRGGSQSAMPNAKIGVAGAWDDAFFDGEDYTPEANFRVPWRRIVNRGQSVVRSVAGGGINIVDNRGNVDVILPFEDWDRATYRAIESLYDRHGVKPCLWVPDMDDPRGTAGYPPDAVYGWISQWEGATMDGPGDYTTFSIGLSGIPMPPVGSI